MNDNRFYVEQEEYYAPLWAIVDSVYDEYYVHNNKLFYETKEDAQIVADKLNTIVKNALIKMRQLGMTRTNFHIVTGKHLD